MEHAVALDLTVPSVVSDGGMVSNQYDLSYTGQNKKNCEIIEALIIIIIITIILIIISMILMIPLYLGARHLR